MKYKIVQNELNEYGAQVLDRAGLYPWEHEKSLLRYKGLMADHYQTWFTFRWEAESLIRKMEKAVQKRDKAVAEQTEYARKRNTIRETI